MSASMVRKSLAIVDADFSSRRDENKAKKKNIVNLMPENHKIVRRVNRKGHKEKVVVLRSESKTTVAEVRKRHKPKEQILKENLQKLKLIQEACSVDLDTEITEQLIKRAVTRRPVKAKKKSKKDQKTAFTEEDFAKFEEEYFDEQQ